MPKSDFWVIRGKYFFQIMTFFVRERFLDSCRVLNLFYFILAIFSRNLQDHVFSRIFRKYPIHSIERSAPDGIFPKAHYSRHKSTN